MMRFLEDTGAVAGDWAAQWLDPVALAIVLGGTLLATALRCGLADMRLVPGKLRELARPAFDPAQTRARMARQVGAIERDGILRAEPVRSGDGDFDSLTDLLIARRSIDALLERHEVHRHGRVETARRAARALDQAAELAPVLGLAGTLIALGTMSQGSGPGGSLAGAIAMAVVTTLYGIALANLVFAPLSSAILRRSEREERDRQAVFDWLARGVRKACPARPPAARSDAASGFGSAASPSASPPVAYELES